MTKNLGRLFIFVLFILFGWALYANTLHHSWHFDDLSYIVHNPDIRDIRDWKTIFYSLSAPAVRFISLYTLALNYHFGQTNVFGYHVVNIITHILNGLLVWWFIRLLCCTPKVRPQFPDKDKNYLPLMVALLFLAHPMQIQAVTYICQRFASVATLFYLLSLCCYVKGRVLDQRRRVYFMGAVLSAVLAMMSKQISITLPVAVVLVEFMFFGTASIKRCFQKKNLWMLCILAAVLLVVPSMYGFNVKKILSLHNSSGSYRGEHVYSHTYFFTQMRVIPTYMRLLLSPNNLNLLYDFHLSSSFFETKVLAGFIFMGGLVVGAFRISCRRPLLAFGILWFFLTLSVESSVIPIRHVIFEHRCYLPSVGFLLAAVVLLKEFSGKPIRWVSICLIIVGTFSFLTVERNKVWRDAISLWSDVKKKSPHKTRAYVNLGIAYTEIKDYKKARAEFNGGIALNPRSVLCYNNLGILFMRQYQFTEALDNLNKAIKLNPSVAEFYNNRGDVLRHMMKYDQALINYDAALEINPDLKQTLSNRGVVLVKLDRRQEALESLNRAVDIDAYYLEARQTRANLYGQLGKYSKALVDYNFVLKYNPNKADAYNNRANAYRKMKNFELALQDYNQAIYLKPDYAEAYNNRGVIYKKSKQYKLAMMNYNRALQLKPDYASAYSNRGNLYHRMRQADQALADYSEALRLKPDSKETYYNRALVYAVLNKKQLALADAQKSYQLGYAGAKNLIQKLK